MPIPRGENHYKARLTREDVQNIREELAHKGNSFTALGKRYGVSRSAIRQIARGESWREIGGPLTLASPPRSRSGYRGVSWHVARRQWKVRWENVIPRSHDQPSRRRARV